MWFIAVEVEQETSAPPPKKKSWICPWLCASVACKVAYSHEAFHFEWQQGEPRKNT